jgi:hypothetical protein
VTRPLQRYTVFGFASTHDALGAEALLEDMGIEIVTIPAPAAIGTRCGIALRLPTDQTDRAERYLESAGIALAATVEIEDF